jgi:hypothetical protein
LIRGAARALLSDRRMRAVVTVALLASLIVAGCQTTIRTRVPFTGPTASTARSCAETCSGAPDADACMRACPGAVEESGKRCADAPDVPASAACTEHQETDTTATAVLVVAGLIVAGAIAIGYADNHCPFC